MRNPLYITEQGAKLSREGKRLLIRKEETQLAQVSTLQVSQVIIFGNIQVTTQALHLLLEEGIETVMLSQSGQFYGRLVGKPSGHGELRVGQVVRSRESAVALGLAQSFVTGKLHNMKVFFQRYARRLDSEEMRGAVSGIDALLERVPRTQTINSLMGVEGQASAIYFGQWKNLLHAPWQFGNRNRRPPTDPVNVLLSFGYTLLQQNILGAVLAAGMDPYIGFLHQINYNRPSLALDLMEEFRPIVIDSVVLRCLNNDIIKTEHFSPGEDENRPLQLSREGIQLFIRELESRLTQEFQHPISGERITYRRLFLLQAYELAACLKLEESERVYRPFVVR